ncbi:MAG: hypothetical protein D6734_05725 [Candidatus Schekmanbacteria bacterium]|nr:MAG: hypothetical protein D6734_05725 [Candidatus Schekmanbacteria bacterium]
MKKFFFKKSKKFLSFVIVAFFLTFALFSSADNERTPHFKINSKFLTTAQELYEWNKYKDSKGPSLAGTESWQSFVKFLEDEFRKTGLVDIKKDKISFHGWFTSNRREDGDWTLSIEGKKIRVASYWAFSGSTPPEGVTAPLVYYDEENPPKSIENKIVVFDTPSLPKPLPPMFKSPGFEFASNPEDLPTDNFTIEQWYQVNYYSRFGGFREILTSGKAAGGLVISKMGPEMASGVYTLPPPPYIFGVPSLFLDRKAGEEVRNFAQKGKMATLKLIAKEKPSEIYFLSALLPGKDYGNENDEIVLLLSHTDGPNISQENGALGILAVMKYFSHIPQNERRRSLLVVLDPQHYIPERHAVDWFKLHSEISKKIVASFAIEHLGQIEYREKGDHFLPTGKPEVTQLFVQNNEKLINSAIEAVKMSKIPRTIVYCPLKKGQGRWNGMGDFAIKRNIPGYGISATMSAYWSLEAGIDKFDKDLMYKQTELAVLLTEVLMDSDLEDIKPIEVKRY